MLKDTVAHVVIQIMSGRYNKEQVNKGHQGLLFMAAASATRVTSLLTPLPRFVLPLYRKLRFNT